MRFRGTLPSRRHSSVRLHSGDSLGTGAVYARVRGGSCALNAMPPFRASLESVSLPPSAEPGAEAACLFEGTPGVSHAKRCADKGVANAGRGPKTGDRAATGR